MATIPSNTSSPGFIESIASSRRKTKENIRVDQLIPSDILTNAENLRVLLEKYYEFMNLKEFIYQSNETYTDTVLDGKAVFRIPDPRNENDTFFTDEDGVNSSLIITDAAGIITQIPLSALNVFITNGNNLPGSLADSASSIGKTFTVTGLESYNTQTATLTTITKFWAGPGPSWAMNTIEAALDIDRAEDNYLELIQREIASFIPRSLQVDRRSLYKALVQYYKIRGSTDSIEIFFRLLFDDEVTVDYPYEKTLIPSSGNWDNGLKQYLDKKGFLSNNDTFLHDSYFYQKFSYLIRTGQNLDTWKDIYNRLVHPAGFIFFGEILIAINLLRSELGDNIKGVTSNKFGVDQFINVYPRFGRATLSSMPGIQPGLIGAEDVPLLVEAFAAEYLPFIFARSHQSGAVSLTVSGGSVISAQILDPGWGYPSTPSIVVTGIPISGQTIVDASVSCTIDEFGRIDTVTVNSGGSNYAAAAASVAGNADVGTIANVFIGNKNYNEYREPPQIIFSAPTATDEDGILLASNISAEAEFTLVNTSIDTVDMINYGRGYDSAPTVTFSDPEDVGGVTAQGFARIDANGRVEGVTVFNPGSGYKKNPTVTFTGGNPDVIATAKAYLVPSQIEDITLTNVGSGYIEEPLLRLASAVVNEQRAKDTEMVLMLLLNMIDNSSTLDPANNYYSLTQTDAHDSQEQFYKNQPIEMWGNLSIKNTGETVINNYNTSTFVNLD